MTTQLNLAPAATINLAEIVKRFDRAMDTSMQAGLDALVGKQVVFSPDEKECSPMEGWEARNRHADIHRITALGELAHVAAIDSSCIFVGDTDDGSIYSSKCGLAISFAGRAVMHFRIGPMLHYVNEESLRSCRLEPRLARIAAMDTSMAKRMIRTRIERMVQGEIGKYLSNAIILVDGSLKSSLFEARSNSLERLVMNCSRNSNLLLGISKTTSLKPLEQLASLLLQRNEAGYIDVEPVVRSMVGNVMGKPLLARLSGDGLVLRVDCMGEPDGSLGRLVANDELAHGYPATLRLAHHVSCFTKTDVSCIRSFMLSRLSVREMACEDIRRTLLERI